MYDAYVSITCWILGRLVDARLVVVDTRPVDVWLGSRLGSWMLGSAWLLSVMGSKILSWMLSVMVMLSWMLVGALGDGDALVDARGYAR